MITIIIIIILGSGHGQFLRGGLSKIFEKDWQKCSFAKNVVLQREPASFPYGASAVHRSFRETSEVFAVFLERQVYVLVLLNYS